MPASGLLSTYDVAQGVLHGGCQENALEKRRDALVIWQKALFFVFLERPRNSIEAVKGAWSISVRDFFTGNYKIVRLLTS